MREGHGDKLLKCCYCTILLQHRVIFRCLVLAYELCSMLMCPPALFVSCGAASAQTP